MTEAPSYPDIDVEDEHIVCVMRTRIERLEEGQEELRVGQKEIRDEQENLRKGQESLRAWLEEKLFVEVGAFRREFQEVMGEKPSDVPKRAGSGIVGTLYDLVNSVSKLKAQVKGLESKRGVSSKPPDEWGENTTQFFLKQTTEEIENLKKAKAEAEAKLKRDSSGKLSDDRRYKLELWKIVLGVVGTGGGAIALERIVHAILNALGGG